MGAITQLGVGLKIYNAKMDFIEKYCEEKGWDDQKITPEQRREIRKHPDYMAIRQQVKDQYGY